MKIIASSSQHLQRLLLQLSQYDVNIEYLKGKENVITDALSRVSPLPITTHDGHQKDINPVHMLTTEIPTAPTSEADFRKATAEDTPSGLLMQAVMNGWPESRKDFHPHLLDYWTYRDEISAKNGILFKGHRLILPENFLTKLFRPSMKATLVLGRCSWWPKSQHSGQR